MASPAATASTPISPTRPERSMRGRARPGKGRVRRRPAGFTLIEVLVVIALIALIGTLTAVAMSGGLQGLRLRGATREVAAQLRFTRAQAIATGQPQRFTIDPAAHRYSAPGKREGRLPEQLGVRFYGARQAAAQPGQGAIVFYPDGASTGGQLELVAGQATRRLSVAWLTGEVRVDGQAGGAP
ncbi:type II secretion system protein GspH [Pseudoxanthomonas winnipegensis]|uniref:Type II secretion system protein H n=2 Tax=Lysobacteraceae TaxID=32033 RepID=A0ABY1WIW0_9GAMM|nr:type II secretion system protein GspH [Pseudoxanthomonas winnipegensis]TAA22567.1 type II secretion system protein GspH [Pseudoxanthomonas winnipegensis]TAH72979.1 type II secretion system protein GspH [Pseudoxanthomonas winnipegensis]